MADAASPQNPKRTVEDNLLVSTALPPLKLQIESRLTFLGRSQITIYNLADADIFVFAQAGEEGEIERWVIVQFESFLSNNTRTYNYAMPFMVRFGSHEYLTDVYAQHFSVSDIPPDSDVEAVKNLLQQRGYAFPEHLIRVRYVRLLGEERRRELLIIYGENLQALGSTAAELPADGRVPDDSALAGLIHRHAQAAVTVVED